MGIFNFSPEEVLTFVAVLIRFSTLVAVLPFTGDRMIPAPIKVLLSLAITLALFPALVRTGAVRPGDAYQWGATTSSIVMTVGAEALFGLVLGFVGRLVFDAILLAGNLTGTFMGFAAASQFDPHTEAQTQTVAEIQMALAMLLFLALDGHHLMLHSVLGSYSIVGLGQAGVTGLLSQQLIEVTGNVIKFGLQLTAPVAISIFAINVFFGVFSKAMPQVNILILSFAITSFVGLVVMMVSMGEFGSVATELFARMGDWFQNVIASMR